jgi:hypothetical protein
MYSRRWATTTALAATAAAVTMTAFLAGCGSGAGKNAYLTTNPTPTPTATPPLSGFFRYVSVVGNKSVVAPTTLNAGEIPETCTGAAPMVTAASTPVQVVRGGSFTVSVTTPTEADTLLVGAANFPNHVSADLNSTTGADAARSTSLCCSAKGTKHPSRKVTAGQKIGDTTRVSVANGFLYEPVISIPSDLPNSVTSFTLTIATVKNGVQSCIATIPVQIVASGQSSNRLQVSLSWTGAVDMDLGVTTPVGEKISFEDTADSTGGSLDVDSNAECIIDNINQENISWGNSTPTSGTYTIKPDLFSDCGRSGSFPYVVTINNNGVQSIVRGTFVAGDDENGTDKSFTIQVGTAGQ